MEVNGLLRYVHVTCWSDWETNEWRSFHAKPTGVIYQYSLFVDVVLIHGEDESCSHIDKVNDVFNAINPRLVRFVVIDLIVL